MGIDPIKPLIFTAVFTGVAAVPLVFLIPKIAAYEHVMGEYGNGLLSNALLWLTLAGVASAPSRCSSPLVAPENECWARRAH